MFDYVALTGSFEDRFIEFVDHLHEHFESPAVVRGGRYLAPTAPGAGARMRRASIDRSSFPGGTTWLSGRQPGPRSDALASNAGPMIPMYEDEQLEDAQFTPCRSVQLCVSEARRRREAPLRRLEGSPASHGDLRLPDPAQSARPVAAACAAGRHARERRQCDRQRAVRPLGRRGDALGRRSRRPHAYPIVSAVDVEAARGDRAGLPEVSRAPGSHICATAGAQLATQRHTPRLVR
jgi:hypothetical protein